MFKIATRNIKQECAVKLCEIYPAYRRVLCGLFDKHKREFKFTKTQQLILMALWLYGTLSLTELSDRICTSNEQATRAVGQLVKGGYVNRVKNESNRRSIEISLAQEGADVIKETLDTATKRLPESIENMDNKDAKTLCDCINKIGEILIRLNP